jgi:calcium-dependent protein kinase
MGQMENNTAKLIDFGLGKLMKTKNEILDTIVGSPLFVAPEVLSGNYTKKCDIWSLGVILFILVGGYPPFLGNDNADTNMKIKKMKYKFKEDNFKDASDEVIDLIKHCLVKEEERFDIEQVLEHKWIKKEKKFPNNTENIYDKLESNLRLYQKMENFEKKIIRFIAMRVNENEVKKLEKFFIALDKDNNGTLSKEEFLSGINGIEEFNLTEKEIQNIFKKIDTNKNKKLEYTEFISAIIDKDIYLNKGKLREVFDAIDKNKNGKISKIDIKNVLNLGENCVKKFENLMEEIGKGKDDEINFDEFFKMICQIISDNMNK